MRIENWLKKRKSLDEPKPQKPHASFGGQPTGVAMA